MWSSIPFSHTKRSHMGVHLLTILHSYPRTPRHNLLINPFQYISSLKFVRKNDKFWRSPSQFSSFHVHIWIFWCASNLTSVFSGLVMIFCYCVSLTRLHLTLRLHKSPLGGKGRVPKREGTGSPYKQLQGIFQHLCRKVLQGERNTCDRNQYTWAFSIDFRTGYHRPFVSPCLWHTNPHHFTLLLILEILNFNWKGPPSKKITKIKIQWTFLDLLSGPIFVPYFSNLLTTKFHFFLFVVQTNSIPIMK